MSNEKNHLDMQKILKFTCLLALLLTFQWSLNAQRPHPGPHHRGPAISHLADELDLSEEQKDQLKALHEKQSEQHRALRDQEFDSPEARREALQALRKEHRQAMEAILTEAQRDRLKALHQEHREKMHERRQEGAQQRKQMHEEMKAYRESKILPVLQQQRARLEEKLSDTDKATLQSIREEHKAARDTREEISKEERRTTRKDPEAYKAQREQLHQLVDKYDAEITTLLDELQDERKDWHKDMEKIAESYRPKDRAQPRRRGHMKAQGLDKGPKKDVSDRRMHRRHRHHDGMLGKAGFLLLEPASLADQSPAAATAELQVFPNPSRAENTVQLRISQAGQYRLELFDREGKMLQLIADAYRQAGSYQETLTIGDLAAGTYYVRLSGPGGVISRPLVISK